VLPLDNTAFVRLQTPRPSAVAGKTVFTYTGENSGIPIGNAPDVMDKDFTITADITVPSGGAEGMIVTFGGRFGGYGMYLLNGKPVFVYNLLDMERFRWEGGVGGLVGDDLFAHALAPGKHTLVFDFKYDGPGPGKGGTGVFTVDGKEMARKTLEHTIPLMMTIDETLDIGVDTRTGVDDSYQLPFKFTGTIDKLTYKLGPSQLAAADQAKAADAVAKATD
jgi:arylsulfatase